jgi:cytochrome c-type biogenesis protein CcmH
MSPFTVVAIAMTVVAMAIIVLPLVRAERAGRSDRAKSNVDLLREQAAELDADLQRGVLTADQHRQARDELERRVVEEAAFERTGPRSWTRGTKATVVLATLAVPAIAAILYLEVGAPQLAGAPSNTAGMSTSGELTPEQVEGFVAEMAARIKKDPRDVEAWLLLARSQAFLGRAEEATAAYRQAIDLSPQAVDALVELAELSIRRGDNSARDEAGQLVDRALAIDARNARGLALAGRLALDAGDHAAAIRYWEKLREIIPKESQTYAALEAGLAEARARAGTPPSPAPEVAAPPAASVAGRVTLKADMAGKISPGDTLFVFARALEGPRMPLAVLRKEAKELPLAFTLDDSMAMAPGMDLSSAGEFMVVARISKSGNVAPQPGDLEGSAGPVRPGATDIHIEIDGVVP